MSRYRNIDIWLTDEQLEMLTKLDDPLVHQTMQALDRCISTREVVATLFQALIFLAQHNASYRKNLLDVMALKPMPPILDTKQ